MARDLLPPANGLASRLTARPCYTVLKPLSREKHDSSGHCAKAELRQYEPCLVAEISVNADDVATAVSEAEQELAAYLETVGRENAYNAKSQAQDMSQLLQRNRGSVLSGLFKVNAKKVPICSVQDLQCSVLEESQLYADGEPVESQSPGGSILFAAERSGSLYSVQYLLAPTLSLATLPRPSTPCIRFRLAPGFCFASYSFHGNEPSSDKVKVKASKLQALCAQHGLQTDSRRLVVQQHHARAAPRWLRVNEVMLAVTNFQTAGLQRNSAAELRHPDDGISKPQALVSPLSSFCRRIHRTALAPADDFFAEMGHRAERWPLFGQCCDQPVLIQRYCSGRWGHTGAKHLSDVVQSTQSAGAEKTPVLCVNCSSRGCQEDGHKRIGEELHA